MHSTSNSAIDFEWFNEKIIHFSTNIDGAISGKISLEDFSCDLWAFSEGQISLLKLLEPGFVTTNILPKIDHFMFYTIFNHYRPMAPTFKSKKKTV